jgi:hypothetical protein
MQQLMEETSECENPHQKKKIKFHSLVGVFSINVEFSKLYLEGK